jgi:sugar (pentulose or hexulose) kinase
MLREPLYLGIDFGTSGCRAIAIDSRARQIAEASTPIPSPKQSSNHAIVQEPEIWWQALKICLDGLNQQLGDGKIMALAVDGTSATLLATDPTGTPLGPALMYNDAQASLEAEQIAQIAPNHAPVHGPSSSLAKALRLSVQGPQERIAHLLHQADWISGKMTGYLGYSDENNCLKLGYDPLRRAWPEWIKKIHLEPHWLPQVVPPGTPLGKLDTRVAIELGLNSDVVVVAGTTDSTAAVLATGISHPGQAVTSLGSTLVLKILSRHPVSAPEYGIYSQRLFDQWLIGGASNSGGAVLAKYFTPDQLHTLSQRIDGSIPSGLDYYPLFAPGERFPIHDPSLEPKLTPRPDSDISFLHGLLEGMARIEAQGYARLESLGAPHPTEVISIGGGATNTAWQRIRQNCLNLPVRTAQHQQAAYGAALLARRGWEKSHTSS